jgi:hypothetical protein
MLVRSITFSPLYVAYTHLSRLEFVHHEALYELGLAHGRVTQQDDLYTKKEREATPQIVNATYHT